MALTSEGRQRRARAAAVTRHHGPELAQADRRALKADAAERYIRELVDGWPPLTADQRSRLAVLLRGDGDEAV